MSVQSPPKVLRIGVVVDGRIAHERLIRPGQDVTLGESTRNTFVLDATAGLPGRTLLFGKRRDGWALHFTPEMDGKLAHKKSVVPLQSLHGLARKRDGGLILPLEDGARGKVQVTARVAVLFQFVPAPPEPKGVRGDFRPKLLDEDDPVYLGFLGMFGTAAAVGMIWVWSQPPIQHVTLEDLTARLPTQITLVQPVEPPPADLEPVERDDGTPAPREDVGDGTATEEPAPLFASDNPQTERELAEQMVEDNPLIAQLDLIRTRSHANSGNAGEDTLFGDDVTHQGLDDAMANLHAEDWTSATPGIRTCVDCDGDLDIELTTMRLDTVLVDEAITKAPVPTGPRVGPPEGPGPEISDDVTTAVRRQSPQLRRCYELALDRNPATQGRIQVAWSISGGHTELVEVVQNATGDALFGVCVAEMIERWDFAPSVEQDVQFPFVFSPGN